MLLLYGDGLKTDDLQFGFQEQVSTTMCTWMVLETIDHFTKNGSDVFICVMDMKKAFDLVKQSKLFDGTDGKEHTSNCIALVVGYVLQTRSKREVEQQDI